MTSPTNDRHDLEKLLDRSSLGRPVARRLRGRAHPTAVSDVLRRSHGDDNQLSDELIEPFALNGYGDLVAVDEILRAGRAAAVDLSQLDAETTRRISDILAGMAIGHRATLQRNSALNFVIRPTASLSQVQVERSQDTQHLKTWDVFVSYAADDKETIARQLLTVLTRLGVTVWFDETELRVGDSLRHRIDNGLSNSAFGVAILSPAFFRQGWTRRELDTMVARTLSGHQRILPIWHKVTADEVHAFNPLLADTVGRNTADYTVSQIGEEIARRVRPDIFAR